MQDTLAEQMVRIETALRGLMQRERDGFPSVLITGGTGTLGTALTRAFLGRQYHVTVLSRDPHHQAIFKDRYPAVRTVLADICDRAAVLDACTGQDIVIHAAALKRVDTGETEIAEFTRVNIEGTRIVAECCEQALVEKALFISSDKAVQPLNFYGVTKAAGERLWCGANGGRARWTTRFTAVRYGNVMGSNGSVLQLWRSRLAAGQPIVVREPGTTRFFMAVEDAVGVVLQALYAMHGGEIFVPRHTPAFALYDLARKVQPDERQWQRQPLGGREKQHERLVAPGECVEPYSDDFVRVWPQEAGGFEVAQEFCSEHAARLSGDEVIRRLEGQA